MRYSVLIAQVLTFAALLFIVFFTVDFASDFDFIHLTLFFVVITK